MRLWSIHPEYLDSKGLVALWRESLLAKKVLSGLTKGYRHHPELDRFKSQKNPASSINAYLLGVWLEAENRGYHFERAKIGRNLAKKKIIITAEQLAWEFEHLKKKLKKRDAGRYRALLKISRIETHTLFSCRE